MIRNKKLISAVAVTSVLAGVLAYTMVSAMTLSGATYFEAESAELTDGALVISDSSASGAEAIMFTSQDNGEVAFSTDAGRAIPDTLYGVTTESVSNLSGLTTSLGSHAKTTTTRVVFQKSMNYPSYRPAINSIRTQGYVMG